MSKTVRPTTFSGLLGSKRFVVSVCAAIAMVLGAMSVGASVFVPTSADREPQRAANMPLFTERNLAAKPPAETGNLFTSQDAFPVSNAVSQSLTVTNTLSLPTSKTSLSIEFGPVKANEGITLGQLQVKVDSPALVQTVQITPAQPNAVSAEPTLSEETSSENSSPAVDSTPPNQESAPEPGSTNTTPPTDTN